MWFADSMTRYRYVSLRQHVVSRLLSQNHLCLRCFTKSQPFCALLFFFFFRPLTIEAKVVSSSSFFIIHKDFGLEKNNLHFAEADVGGGEEGAGRQRPREAVLARLHPLRVAGIVDVLPDRSGHFEEVCVGELVRGPGSVAFRFSLLLFDTRCDDVVEDVVERERFAGMVVARCGTTLGTVTGAGFGDAHGWRMGLVCGFFVC